MKLLKVYILLFALLGYSSITTAQKKSHAKKQPAKHTKKTIANPEKKKAENQTKVAEKKTATKDTSDLKSTTIEISQSYRPEIRLDIKRESVPLLPPVDTATANVNYTVPSQSLSYGYFALPLRPLALAKDSAERSFANYVKAGGGNLSTVYLDAGIGSIHGNNYGLALRLHHLSQAGKIKDQKTSLSGLEADGNYVAKKLLWNTGVSFHRNTYNYYGYDLNTRTTGYSTISKPEYYSAQVQIGAENKNAGKYSYKPYLTAVYFSNNDGHEYQVSALVPVAYQVNTCLSIKTGVAASFTNLNRQLALPAHSNLAQAIVGADYQKGSLYVSAMVYPTTGQTNSYLVPDFYASYTINAKEWVIFAGVKGELYQNTYEQLATKNPYLYNMYWLEQSHANKVYGGVRTNIGNHFSVRGEVSWTKHDNMPLFINDTGFYNRYFIVTYDKVNALSFDGAVRYQMGDFISVGFGVTYTSFNTTINKRAWHEPGLKLNGDLIVHPLPKLTVTANMAILDEIYAVDMGNKTVKLKNITDLGLGVEYNFIPRLSGFVQANNILNKSYERWYGYQAYRFNIFGGIRLKF
jgi:hypothetical protein